MHCIKMRLSVKFFLKKSIHLIRPGADAIKKFTPSLGIPDLGVYVDS